MKKISLLLLVLLSILFFSFLPPESSLYDMQFKSLDTGTIDMSSYKSKKLIIVEFHAGKPNYAQLLSLDTLYRQHKNNLSVIAVPVADFGQAMPEKDLIKLVRDSLKLSYPVTAVSNAQKKQGYGQHSLLQWLTSKAKNRHFDADVEEEGQLYVISETGILYAVLKQKISPTGSMMQEVLGRQVTE